MALVMKTESVENFLKNNVTVTNGKYEHFEIDGVTHFDVITYPAQGDFASDIVLGMIQKPFIDFAVSCGDAGAMTAKMICDKYEGIPSNLAESIATDFAKAYNNYIVIPEMMTLMITGAPIASVFAIMIPEPPVENDIDEEV